MHVVVVPVCSLHVKCIVALDKRGASE
eukprot:COSAG03_NODE_14579_length_459_cov_0.691667_1_plen_26_part_10